MPCKSSTHWLCAAIALGCLTSTPVAIAGQVSAPDAAAQPEAREPIILDAAVLDRYVGDYQLSPTAILTVSRDETHLFAQLTGQAKVEIFARSDKEFFYRVVNAQISFQTDSQGRSAGLVLHQNGRNVSGVRVDATVAAQIAADTAAKVKSQAPTPGSEAALRRLIEALRTGSPNYAEMSPELARATREQLPQLEAEIKRLGMVQSLEFHGVGNRGWDVYEVRHEHGSSQWRISMGADGIILGALISEGP